MNRIVNNIFLERNLTFFLKTYKKMCNPTIKMLKYIVIILLLLLLLLLLLSENEIDNSCGC